MKLNVFLICLLSSLIGLAYFLEKDEEKATMDKELKGKVVQISLKDISSVKLPHLSFYRQNQRWYSKKNNIPLSQYQVESIVNQLNSLNIIRKIGKVEDSKAFFTQVNIDFHLKLENIVLKFKLGDYLPQREGFYLSLNNQVFLVRSLMNYTEAYRSESEKRIKQFLMLKELILAKKKHFIERNILAYINLDDISSLKVDRASQDSFVADLKGEQLVPMPSKGIKLKNLKSVFVSQIQGTLVENVYLENQSSLSQKMGMIVLEHEGKVVNLHLFLKFNGLQGEFIHNEETGMILELQKGRRDFFFISAQNFWVKRIEHPKDLYGKKNIVFTVKTGDIKGKYLIEDLADFSVKAIDERKILDIKRINFIFNLLFHQKPFEEAAHISKAEKSDLTNSELVMTIKGRTFYFSINKGLIELIDGNSLVKFFFLYDDKAISKDIFTGFFTQK